MSFPQFFTWRAPFTSFARSLKYSLLALVRIALGRSVKISYGFTGEDRLIESLLKKSITHKGFYVDVGCNHPKFISNTFLLYRRGWRGICIDANERLIRKFRRIRPRDAAVCSVVSDDKQPRVFYELTNNVLSTIEKEHLDEYIREGQKIVRELTLKPETLTEILDRYKAPAVFDLLSIDAEEHDLNVLRSLDLSRYTPKLIATEVENFDPSNPGDSEVYLYLISRKYRLEGSILKNLYFTYQG